MGYHIGPTRVATPLWLAVSLIFAMAFSSMASATSANISQLSIVSIPQTIDKETVSKPITIEFQNTSSTKEALDISGAQLELATSSPTGSFYTSTIGSAAHTSVALSGEWSSKTVYYKDSTPGAHHLQFTLRGGGLKENLAVSQDIHINDNNNAQPVAIESVPDILDLEVPSAQEGTPVTIRGKLDSATDTSVTLQNRNDSTKTYEAIIHPDNTFSYEFTTGLPKGEYVFEAVAKRGENKSQPFLRKTIIEEAPSTPPINIPTEPEIQVPKPTPPVIELPDDQFISPLSVEPVPLLSTTFATPLVSPGTLLRASDSLSARTLAVQSSVLRGNDSAPIMQRKTVSLDAEKILPLPSLKTAQEPASSSSALTPTQSGWTIFGISWQWWAGGIATTVVGWWVYRSLRKIA